MFYSVFVLGKKGPLARVWLAAHWDKKITKAQILETNIVESVDSILQPKIKLSLRTSSHLLLGIVRIYSRKALYLLQDCQDAAFKIKSAFRPGVVDLPDGKTEAAISAITLPEMFEFDINDFDLMAEPQLHMDPPATTANIRNITLVEDISSIHVDDPLMMNEVREWSDIGSIGGGSINIKDSTDHNLNDSGISLKNNFDLYDRPALDDGFGGQLGVGIVDDVDADDVFNMPMPDNINKDSVNLENGHLNENDLNSNNINNKNDENPIADRPTSALSDASDNSFGGAASFGAPSSPESIADDNDPFSSIQQDNSNGQLNDDLIPGTGGENKLNDPQQMSQNTMVLEPIDPQLGNLDKKGKRRRKKIGMVIDEIKTLSGEEMKAQLSDTTDIVTNLDLAPPNKMLMNWKKTGLSDKLFTLPERTISAKVLIQYYSRNLITNRYEDNDEEDLLNDDRSIILPIHRHRLPPEDLERPLNGLDGSSIDQMPLEDFDRLQQSQLDSSPQPPRTPRHYKNMQSPSPYKQKRKKQEDKENKETYTNNKRLRDSKYEKINNNNANTNTTSTNNNNNNYPNDKNNQTLGLDANNLLHDSSIPEFREHTASDVHGSYHLDHQNNKNLDPNFLTRDEQSEEEKDDDEDDLFDYGGPMSVGPAEEMLPDETIDQYEERIRAKRYNILLKYMAPQLEDNGHIEFTSIVRNNKRKMVAQKFYALLVLKKQMAIDLYQNAEMPYSELIITKGNKYEEHMVSSVVT